MRAKRVLALLMLALFLCVCGCWARRSAQEETAADEEQPLLTVLLTPEAGRVAPASLLLEDAAFRTRIGRDVGAMLQVEVLTASDNSGDIAAGLYSEDFDGVLFLTKPVQIAQLAEQEFLLELKKEAKQTSFFQAYQDVQVAGRYLGRQYGLCFPDGVLQQQHPVIVVRTDILERAGVMYVEPTPAAVHAALACLKEEGVIPLAVSGSPASDGFDPLLSLFSMSGRGVGEFVLQSGRVAFTKTMPAAEKYLAYVHGLYAQELIPKDFLNITQYDLIYMLAEGKCAAAVFTDGLYAAEALAAAEELGVSVAVAPYSAACRVGTPNAYDKLTGVIAADVSDESAALRLFEALQANESAWRPLAETVPELPGQPYKLFAPAAQRSFPVDPVAYCDYNIDMRNTKRRLDTTLIDSAYAKIVTGELPISEFSVMCADWENAGGATLIEMYTRYYHNALSAGLQ